jgi:hypothetical protein
MDTGSAIQPVAGQRAPDEMLSLVLAEVAGGKRGTGRRCCTKARPRGEVWSTTAASTCGSGDFPRQAPASPCLERSGNGEEIRCWRPCQMELRSRIR